MAESFKDLSINYSDIARALEDEERRRQQRQQQNEQQNQQAGQSAQKGVGVGASAYKAFSGGSTATTAAPTSASSASAGGTSAGGSGAIGGGSTAGGGGAAVTSGGTGATAGSVGAGGSGAGGSAAGGSGGIGALGIGAIVAAAIGAQHYMSNETDTEYEGQKTDDAFAGNFGTEPWMGFANDKLGLGVSSGEKFDAATSNSDWSTAAERGPGVAHQWMSPATEMVYGGVEKYAGKDVANITDPAHYIMNNEDAFDLDNFKHPEQAGAFSQPRDWARDGYDSAEDTVKDLSKDGLDSVSTAADKSVGWAEDAFDWIGNLF